MKKILMLSCCLIFLIITQLIFCDDGFYTMGQGGVLIPLKNNNISMIAETVKIDIYKMSYDVYKAYFNCEFHFQNQSSQPQDVLMGFPIDYGRGGSAILGASLGQNEVINFQAQINNKNISFIRYLHGINPELAAIKQYDEVFGFRVNFNPNEKKKITNTYETILSRGSIGHDDIKYILLSALTWKDPIKQADIIITFHFPIYTEKRITIKPEGYLLNKGDNTTITYSFQNLVPTADIYISFNEIVDKNQTRNQKQDEEVQKELEAIKEIRKQNDLERIPLIEKALIANPGNNSFFKPALLLARIYSHYGVSQKLLKKIDTERIKQTLHDYFISILNQSIIDETQSPTAIENNIFAYKIIDFYEYYTGKMAVLIKNLRSKSSKSDITALTHIINRILLVQVIGLEQGYLTINKLRKEKDLIRNALYELGNYYFSLDTEKAIKYYKCSLLFARAIDSNLPQCIDINKLPPLYKITKLPFSDWPDEGKNNAPCYYIAYNLCCAYTQLSDVEQAFDWLEKALQMHYPSQDWLQKDPDITLLREDNNKRFREIVDKYF